MSTVEKNYTTKEREGLAMVYALQKLRHYLLGSHFKMYTHHSALKYLVNKSMLGGRFLDGFYNFKSMILKLLLNSGDSMQDLIICRGYNQANNLRVWRMDYLMRNCFW